MKVKFHEGFKDLYTKKRELKVKYQGFRYITAGRHHLTGWSKSGRIFNLYSKESDFLELLKILGLRYKKGNDAPKGGKIGDYIEITELCAVKVNYALNLTNFDGVFQKYKDCDAFHKNPPKWATKEQIKAARKNSLAFWRASVHTSDSQREHNPNGKTIRIYTAKIKHDKGTFNLNVLAESAMEAIAKVMKAEGCPQCAIVNISLNTYRQW